MKPVSIVLGLFMIAIFAFAPGCRTPSRAPAPKAETIVVARHARTAAASEAAAIETSSQSLETSLQALHRAVEQLQQVLTELKAAEAHRNR